METKEPTRTKAGDRDSSVERNLSPDRDMGINASKLNRLHLDKPKLSGAARRRLKKARSRGEGTEGFMQSGPSSHASTSAPQTGPGTSKRTRTSSETPPSAKAKPTKRPRGTEPGVSFREALASPKMAIIKTSYPEDKLTESDIQYVQEVILRKIDEAQSSESLPLLRTFSLQDGALIYYCENQDTCNWLQKNLDGVEIKDKSILKVVEAKDLPKPVKVAFRTRDLKTSDPKVLLRRMQLLNKGLQTEHWKVVDRQPDPKGQRLILLMDKKSAELITSLGLAAYTGVDRGQFKILSDPGNKTGQETNLDEAAAKEGKDTTEPMETKDSSDTSPSETVQVSDVIS